MLVDTFKTLKQEHGQSIVIISHQERIIDLADDVMVLAAGKISAFGPREEVLPGLQSQSGPCPIGWHPKQPAVDMV